MSLFHLESRNPDLDFVGEYVVDLIGYGEHQEAEVRRPKYKPRKDGNECGYKPMEFI
jgi:hypothetical protein